MFSKKTGLQTSGVDSEGCLQARLTVNRSRVAASGVLDSPCGRPSPLLCGSSSRADGIVLHGRVRQVNEDSGQTATRSQHTNEVTILEVVAVQLVAGLLRI